MLKQQVNSGQSNIFASDGAMIESTRYNDMYLRPYETFYDKSVERLLDDYTEGGVDLSTSAIGRVSTHFLKPAAMPGNSVVIANGFGERRYSFMIEVQSAGKLKGNMVTVLTGYTDYVGVVQGRNGPILDPDMSMFFNGLYVYRNQEVPTRHGTETTSNVSRGTQIAHTSSTASEDAFGGYSNPIFMARPEDISGVLAYEADPTMAGFRNSGGGDYRNTLTNAPKASSRSNMARSSYLSDILSSYKTAAGDEDFLEDTDVWTGTRSNAREKSINENEVMLQLSLHTSYTATGCVTYGELCDIIPNLDDVINVAGAQTVKTDPRALSEQTSNWGAATTHAQAATLIQQSVTAIMSDCLLLGVHFVATNDTIDGKTQLNVGAFNSYNKNIDMTRHIERFKDRIYLEILNDLSMYDALPFTADVHIELLYNATITVTIDNEPDELFVAPAFCDAIYASTLAGSQTVIEDIASDISAMVTSLQGLHPQQEWTSPIERNGRTQQVDGRQFNRQQQPQHRGERFNRSPGGVIIPDSI